MSFTTSPIFWAVSARLRTAAPVSFVSVAACPATSADCEVCRLISPIELDNSSAELATIWTFSEAPSEALEIKPTCSPAFSAPDVIEVAVRSSSSQALDTVWTTPLTAPSSIVARSFNDLRRCSSACSVRMTCCASSRTRSIGAFKHADGARHGANFVAPIQSRNFNLGTTFGEPAHHLRHLIERPGDEHQGRPNGHHEHPQDDYELKNPGLNCLCNPTSELPVGHSKNR